MKRFSPSALLAASLFAGACDAGLGPDSIETGGAIEVALTSAPTEASCLNVTVTGSRTVSRLIPLTPGQSTVFAIDKLPVGLANVDGAAYAQPCAMVTSATVPTFVSEAPVPVRVDPVSVARVLLKLLRNGRVAVEVDFEPPPWISPGRAPLDLAVFGDTPYGATQIADVPNFIASIDKDPDVRLSVHLGDIKNGSSRCDTTYFKLIADSFDKLKKPFLFTPGDNEWTDCHRANNGAYDPLERLGVLRGFFFPLPGLSLGQSKKEVLPQSATPGFETFVENQVWVEGGAVFSLLHVVGSNNGLAPWFGDAAPGTKTDDPVRRLAEVTARNAANLAWLDRTFELAKLYDTATVVLMMQADMWDTGRNEGFDDTIQRIAALSLAYGKPVLIIQGDSHIYKVDNPLAAGDPVHGVATPVPNLTRLVVQGSTTAPLSEWVKLHIDASASPPFSWSRITH